MKLATVNAMSCLFLSSLLVLPVDAAPGPTPMSNLYLALLRRLKVKAQRIGDSTGVLEDI